MENAACVLRNLSYRLENEVDPQEGTGDVLDHDWEEEQRKDMDEITQPFSNSSPGCLAFLKRSRGSSRRERGRVHSPMVSRPSYSVDYANPGEYTWSNQSTSLINYCVDTGYRIAGIFQGYKMFTVFAD